MRKSSQWIAGLALGFALSAGTLLADIAPPDHVVWVDPRIASGTPAVTTTVIPQSLLLTGFPAGTTIVSHTGVLRGTLTRDSGTGDFSFSPWIDFWSLGTDRFTYTAQLPGGDTRIGVVMLAGVTAGVEDSNEDFDDSVLDPNWDIPAPAIGTATIANGVLTILGTVQSPNEAEAHIERDNFANSIRGLSQGGKVLGGGGSPPPQPPPPPGGLVESPWSFRLMQGAAFNNSSPFWVELRPEGIFDSVRLGWLNDDGSKSYGDWIAVGPSPHDYELNWWETGNLPQVMFWVDGRLVEQRAVDTLAGVDRFEMGVLSRHPVTSPGLSIDDVALWSWGYEYDSPIPRVDVKLIESFEDNLAHPLDLIGSAQISAVNPLNGTRDIVVDAIAGQTAKFEWAPPSSGGDGSWNARFRLRIDNLQIPVNAVVTIAEAFSALQGRIPFRVELRRNAGNVHQLRMVVKRDNGPDLVSPWEHVATTGANVEVQWWTPRSPSLDTGGARLWVGAVLRQEIKNVRNHGHIVEGFRMGMIAPASTITGYARFDTIQIWSNQ